MRTLPPIFAKGGRFYFTRLIVNGVLQALMIVGSMLLVRHAFDVLLNPAFDDPEVNLFEMTEVSTIGLFAIGLLACTGFAALLRLLEQVDAELLGQDYIHRVRMTLYDQMSKFAPRSLGQRSSGGTMLRFVGDLTALRRWVSLGLARIVVALIVTILALGFLAYLDRYLAIVSLVILMIGLCGNLLLGPRMHRAISESRRRRGHLAGNINEKIRSFGVIQAFNQTKRERKKFRRQSLRLRDAMVARSWSSGLMRIVTEGSTALSMGLVLSLGALEVFRGMTSAGNVVAAMAVVGFISNAFRDLGRVHEHRQSARVSEQKIVQFLRTRTMRGRSSKLPDLMVKDGIVSFEEISLNGSLDKVSATAPGGARIALVGPNGAGKSTLLQIAARLIDPDSGQISIDGQDLLQCNLASVRSVIGIISPDLPLLRGSVRYNLRYRRPDATPEELERVWELCQLDELIDTLPGGEEFRIQESGQNLSLGQRHRLAIARALLGNPALLIVDEIDANLDPHVEVVLDRVLDDFPGTILMVTRSEVRLKKADYHWHLVGGRLVGTDELTRRKSGDTKIRRDPVSIVEFTNEGDLMAKPITPGTIHRRSIDGMQQLEYFAYVPTHGQRNNRVFVSVHGISRNAEQHLQGFMSQAERYGAIMLAPLFPLGSFPHYQRLGSNVNQERSDLALDQVLKDAAEWLGIRSDPLHIFGFSGGGQFTHRYAMFYPKRVKRMVLGAPGWYTFPDPEQKYPLGLRSTGDWPRLKFTPAQFLKIATLVLVGDEDDIRDDDLNKTRRVDAAQGLNRVERGERWINSMRALSRAFNVQSDFRFELVPNANHAYESYLSHPPFAEQVFSFLFGKEL